MKGLLNKFDKLMSAVTFAEAGEFDTAREIMKETDGPKKSATVKCPHCGASANIDSMPEPNKA